MGIKLVSIEGGEMKFLERMHHSKIQSLFLSESEFKRYCGSLDKKGKKHVYVNYVAVLGGHHEGNIYISSISMDKKNLIHEERYERIHFSSIEFLCGRFSEIEKMLKTNSKDVKIKKPINLVYCSWITGEFL